MQSTSDQYEDLPPIDVSHCVKVTTVAAEPMLHVSPSKSVSPSKKPLQRQTRNFTETDIKDFASFLKQGMAESTGLVLVFIENWHKWAFESLIDAFPNFPVQLLHEMNGGLNHTMLPVFGDDSTELCYIMDNIDVAETPQRTYSQGSMRLGLWEAQRMPVRLLV
ncbi:hypothetical protein Trihar35433_9133 [Trichoderma harzianum]|nr:hypothetical protein Trihar35433_9133 [Trichoderma harzianum]